MTVLEPTGSNVKVNFVHCSACGATVGVMDFFAAGQIANEIRADVGKIEKKLDYLSSHVAAIQAALQRR